MDQRYEKLWEANRKVYQRLDGLQERIGHRFKAPHLLFEALTHRSALTELGGDRTLYAGLPWNERLEFLGDSVLGLAITRRLMESSEVHAEGELSRMRAALVNEESLAEVARRIGLGDCLLLGRGAEASGGRGRDSLLADALEALIGAVFNDGGFPAADTVVGCLFSDSFGARLQALAQSDFKTMLQEFTQERMRMTPRYDVVREFGPDHDKQFEVVVVLGEKELGRGVGASKKRASQVAAREAFDNLMANAISTDHRGLKS